MVPDQDFEHGIQALLDGRPLTVRPGASDSDPSVTDPLHVIDAIARVHRATLFGKDISLDRPIATRWGHLEIRGEIGRGASGTVYRAWDTRLAREVALKLFTEDTSPGDALEEGRLLARLNHPHIVSVFGADTHDGTAGIWMELLEGETLDEILARDGVFGGEETVLIGLDLSRALSAVHAAGLLHRDVKARNVVRERGGRVVLMDLGAGRATDKTPIDGDGTGTPMYMAPEVLAGGPATDQSDVYCLGVLLYRLLSGRFPVTADDLKRLRSAHVEGGRVQLGALRQDLHSAVVTTIERACDPNPDVRYTSAAALELALTEALQRTLQDRAFVATPMKRAARRWRKTALIVLTAVWVTLLTTWEVWDTTPGRAARRALGLSVPPRSTLYLMVNGGLGLLRGRRLTLVAHNPANATVIAVSDLGIRTMPAIPPWTMGGSFRLDGTPVGVAPIANADLCCWADGTTDGQFNFATRADSTLLEPIGSRPLAPAGLYRFGRDWSNPQLLFPLESGGVYFGVAYSAASNSFWLARTLPSGSVLEEWSRDGKHLATPVSIPAAVLKSVAVDPWDGTVWVVRDQSAAAVIRLENFNRTGRHLGSFDIERPLQTIEPGGAEFEWIQPK